MSFWKWLHGNKVHVRRVNVLRDLIVDLIPQDVRVLDVGCGDGFLSRLIGESRPDIHIQGLEVLARPDAEIPVEVFDGKKVPFADDEFDVLLFIDVLHHVEDVPRLLSEAARVSAQGIVIKDHVRDGFLAGHQLRLMDWLANRRHGISPPCRYFTRAEWLRFFRTIGARETKRHDKLQLYPQPLDWIFGRGLHFLAYCELPANDESL